MTPSQIIELEVARVEVPMSDALNRALSSVEEMEQENAQLRADWRTQNACIAEQHDELAKLREELASSSDSLHAAHSLGYADGHAAGLTKGREERSTELAAAQAVIEQMREIFKEIEKTERVRMYETCPDCDFADCSRENGCRYVENPAPLARKALALPTDDTALLDRLRQERERVCELLKKEGEGEGYVINAIRNMGDE